MVSPFVKGGVRLPNGSWVSRCGDDTAVKALAVRLGVYAQVSAGLRRDVATPGSAALCCDGDALVAIMAWRGFASAKDNGWLALRVAPASEENAGWLAHFWRWRRRRKSSTPANTNLPDHHS